MTIGYLEEFITDGKVREEPEDLDVILARQERLLRGREERVLREKVTGAPREAETGEVEGVLAS